MLLAVYWAVFQIFPLRFITRNSLKQNLQEARYNTSVLNNDDTSILCVKWCLLMVIAWQTSKLFKDQWFPRLDDLCSQLFVSSISRQSHGCPWWCYKLFAASISRQTHDYLWWRYYPWPWPRLVVQIRVQLQSHLRNVVDGCRVWWIRCNIA